MPAVEAAAPLDAASPVDSVSKSYPRVVSELPVWRLVLGWLVVIPLLFFMNSALSFGKPEAALRVTASDASPLHRLGMGFVGLLCGLLVLTRWRQVFSLCQRAKLLLALPALALISCLWSLDPGQTLSSSIGLTVMTLFALYLYGAFSHSRQFELLMLAGGLALPASLALVALAPSIGTSGDAWLGLFGHKQNAGIISIILLVTSLHWKPSNMPQRLLQWVCAALSVVFIVMARSRTGWALALAAVLLTWALSLLQRLPAKDALVISLLSIPAISAAAYVVHEYAGLLLNTVGRDPTLDERTIIWGAVWGAITKRPLLGYGWSAFWGTRLNGESVNIILAAGWQLQQAQDGFLDLCLGVGVCGVLLVIFMTLQAMKSGAGCFRAQGERTYVRWCIVMIASTLIYNVGESTLGLSHLSWLLFLLACIGLKETARQQRWAKSAR
jgi:exopolysaccharide production protein ExoQ